MINGLQNLMNESLGSCNYMLRSTNPFHALALFPQAFSTPLVLKCINLNAVVVLSAIVGDPSNR